MKKKTNKKQLQIVEIHIYVHQENPYGSNGSTSYPTQQTCPYCGKIGPHICAA